MTAVCRGTGRSSGAQMLITASGTGLTVVIAAMAALWLVATIRHSLPAKTGLPQQPASTGHLRQ